MKSYVLNVEDEIAERAESLSPGRTLDSLVTELLRDFINGQERVARYHALMDEMKYLGPLPVLTREERNAR